MGLPDGRRQVPPATQSSQKRASAVSKNRGTSSSGSVSGSWSTRACAAAVMAASALNCMVSLRALTGGPSP